MENQINKNGRPNAQNSEQDPNLHPSGARIEKMYDSKPAANEKGTAGETLRPSEREPKYPSTQDKPEGER